MIDSRDKRFSLIGFGHSYLAAVLPDPDGSFDASNRAHLIGLYAGIALVAPGILNEIIEGSITLRQALRIILSASAGKISGAGSTNVKFRDTTDAVDRIDETTDSDGNRLSVTLNLTGATGGGPDTIDQIIEGSITFREAIRLILAASAGKLSGAGTGSTNVKIRDTLDSKDRIDATVDDDGNRTAIALDKS